MTYEQIKANYERGTMSITVVKLACKKGVISKEEYKLITGCIYPSIIPVNG